MSTTPGEFAQALQKQRRKRRLFRWVLIGGLALLVILGGTATWLLGFSSTFAATEVTVSGTSVLTQQQVVDAAQVELGRPLIRQDLTAIDERVSALPPAQEVTVNRRFPHSIDIAVTERQIAYVWNDGTTLKWVDAAGVVFQQGVEPPAGTVVAQIEGQPDQRLLRDVATVVASARPVLADRIGMVHAAAVDQIEVRLGDGDIVVWGSADQSEMKAQVLGVLLQVDATVYDVSAPGAPTTR